MSMTLPCQMNSMCSNILRCAVVASTGECLGTSFMELLKKLRPKFVNILPFECKKSCSFMTVVCKEGW